MKASLLLLGFGTGLIIHVYIVFTGAPEIFWIVDLQTAVISAVIEIIIAPLVLFIGLRKLLVSLHDRQKPFPLDLFKDENQLW